jgi:hypothetical protein
VPVIFDLRLNGWAPFAGWGTNETIAFVTLVITIVGLTGTTINTYRSSRSAQKLLENELRATLDIPPTPREVFPTSQGDGLLVEDVQDLMEGGPHVRMSGFVRNIGRFVARDIELTPFLGERQGRVMDPFQQTLFPDALSSQFDLHLPFSLVDPTDPNSSLAALFASGEQTRLVFRFKDGNPTADRTKCASRLLAVRNRKHGFRRRWSVKAAQLDGDSANPRHEAGATEAAPSDHENGTSRR